MCAYVAETTADTTRRPIAEGLFEDADDGSGIPWLLGSRCSKCDEVVFPAMSDCPNCVSHDTMRPHRLKGRGVLSDFVIVHRGAKGFRVPYVQAHVKLDDGPVIYSNLDGVPIEETKIEVGTVVQMRVGVIKTLDGVEYVGWTFHPVGRTP
jgi:uncharacterized OB-fold protein